MQNLHVLCIRRKLIRYFTLDLVLAKVTVLRQTKTNKQTAFIGCPYKEEQKKMRDFRNSASQVGDGC